jgi:hypothetical protein
MLHQLQPGKPAGALALAGLVALAALLGPGCSAIGPYGHPGPSLPPHHHSRDLVRMPAKLQGEEQRRIGAVVDVLERRGFYPVSPHGYADAPLELSFQLRSNMPLDIWCEIVLLRDGRELARGDGKVMGPWALLHGSRAAYDDAFRQALEAFRSSL